MIDFVYDIDAQDLVVQTGGLITTDNPSVQNGGLILLARAFNSLNPILGINVNQVRGGSVLQANYEFNRWKSQVISDGGKAAVSAITDNAGNTGFDWEVNYL